MGSTEEPSADRQGQTLTMNCLATAGAIFRLVPCHLRLRLEHGRQETAFQKIRPAKAQ